MRALKQAYVSDVAATTAVGRSNLNLAVVHTTIDCMLLHPDRSDKDAQGMCAQL